MMEMSRRARRMERHHRNRKQPALNLVSLMDIFTILVFFLLVTSSNSQQLPNNKDIKLPTSVAKKTPKETLVIAITKKDILVQGRRVALTSEVLANENLVIAGLQTELMFQASKQPLLVDKSLSDVDKQQGRAITIMGDEQLSYELLRKILATCRQANYTQIAFAAMQKSKKS